MSNRNLHSKKPPKRKVSISDKLRAQLLVAKAKKVLPLNELAQVRYEVEKNAASVKMPLDIEKEGCDPVFSLYASVQQLLSLCAETLLQMPELRSFNRELEKAEYDYMPSFPPMSPITSSYFAMWTLCDLRIGGVGETMAHTFANLGDLFGLDAEYLELVRKLAHSRMGIYEHLGLRDNKIVLCELVTNKEILFVCNSMYSGNKGELWYVRAVPPPSECIPYWVSMGTPHVLRAPQKSEWLAFFERNGIRSGEVGFERRLEAFLKFGPTPRFWSEFIFEAYSGHNPGALFLWGLPDVPESRPHSKSFNPSIHLGA